MKATGWKPKINLEEGNPLETRAVVAAHGPGMQIIFNPRDLALFSGVDDRLWDRRC